MAIGSFAQEILDALAPMLYAEDATGHALETFVGAIGDTGFQDIENIVSDTPTGDPGWSIVLDVDNCPDYVLPWLAQTVGVKLTGGLSAADQRQQIKGLANWKRGTVEVMKAAPQPYLTGSKVVVFRERYDTNNPGVDAPYHLTVITYTDQTPYPVVVLNALTAQKPGGIILHYLVNSGQDFQSLKNNYLTFNDVKNAYSTFNGVLLDEPGT